MAKPRDDHGPMFTDDDVQRVVEDVESVQEMCGSEIHFRVARSNALTGPCMTIYASAPGVGSASVVFGVDMWARIAEQPSRVVRGVMWFAMLQDQLIATAQHEWRGSAVDDESEDDD